jgi:hypothetical protein
MLMGCHGPDPVGGLHMQAGFGGIEVIRDIILCIIADMTQVVLNLTLQLLHKSVPIGARQFFAGAGMPATSAAYRRHGPLLQHIIWNVILTITIMPIVGLVEGRTPTNDPSL